jgi:hypothetical protein
VNTQVGFAAQDGFGTLGANTAFEVDPNLRGGRWGIIPTVIRNTGQGEFRGRLRYHFFAPVQVGLWQFLEDRNGNFYFVATYVLREALSNVKLAVGPISANLAKAYT